MVSSPHHATYPSPSNREIRIVLILTLIGGMIRLWGLGRLGLTHFDEGIYAIAGLWAVSPRSLAGLDPTVISYAPGGFPFLVGLAYHGLGVSDIASILPSILTATFTIPAVALLAHRTFGLGAGAPAAAMTALSGFHVAFSRMALTDASFLFFWVLALIAGQRFLERPGATRGVVLGLSVGLAQWFKYNGWLAGVAVPMAACLGLAIDAKERESARIRAIWGGGLLAAAVAALAYWPWFDFVESHGGYAALLRHHGSYVGGLSTWFEHWRIQLEQAGALSGGLIWSLTGASFACLVGRLTRPSRTFSAPALRSALLLMALIAFLAVAPASSWWLGVPWVIGRWKVARPGERLLQVAWTGLSVLTPFYHPYARLWLPLQSIGWVLVGGLVAWLLAWGQGGSVAEHLARFRSGRSLVVTTVVCALLAMLQGLALPGRSLSGTSLPGPMALAPNPTIRGALTRVFHDLPPGLPALRVLARPTVIFYLGGKVPVQVEADLENLLAARGGEGWALVDAVQLCQGGDLESASRRLLESWELVGEYPTTLNLPTLLDVDPGAARTGTSALVNAPLLLLRPKPRGK